MSFIWTSVAIVLALQLVLLSLFVIPFPWGVRKNISRALLRPNIRRAVDTALRYVGVGLVLAVVESVNALMRLDSRVEEVQLANTGSGGDVTAAKVLSMHDFRYRRAMCQRNLYLAGFCLVIGLSAFLRAAALPPPPPCPGRETSLTSTMRLRSVSSACAQPSSSTGWWTSSPMRRASGPGSRSSTAASLWIKREILSRGRRPSSA
jgi:Bap31/Bap29 transmembrane region